MPLRQWDPFPGLRHLQREVDRLFDRALGHITDEAASEQIGWAPPVDFSETEDAYVLRFDLPGVPRDAIDLSVEDNVLTLNGERKAAELGDDERLIRQERVTGRFHRCLSLPGGADASNVNARCADGVLEVTIGKAQEAKRHKIEIKGE